MTLPPQDTGKTSTTTPTATNTTDYTEHTNTNTNQYATTGTPGNTNTEDLWFTINNLWFLIFENDIRCYNASFYTNSLIYKVVHM